MSTIVSRKPVNGRVWKNSEQKPSKQLRKGVLMGWEKQQELRRQRDIVKKIEKENSDKKKEEQEERKKRKQENEERAQVMQKVSAAKVRRMKKKQLKGIKKT
ncbi:hypothetical protein EDD86DRAFT_245959 [Gorgonomyces haynaldii]|nr:hypothetical protein EDD86DRAFT_245959 [Gorgonomyces haynaldii]